MIHFSLTKTFSQQILRRLSFDRCVAQLIEVQMNALSHIFLSMLIYVVNLMRPPKLLLTY